MPLPSRRPRRHKNFSGRRAISPSTLSTSSIQPWRTRLPAPKCRYEQISVVSQNIARVNNSDATRKIANVITVGGGGVSVAGISRTANKLLLDTYLSANASNRTQTVVNSALDRLENTVGDTDTESSPAALTPN